MPPHSPRNYTVVVTVTDYTFWESIEIELAVGQEEGVDLTLSPHDISFSPPDPVESDNVDNSATIHNVGTDDATNVLIAFYDDGKPVGNRTIALIPGGGSEDTTIFWNATPWGGHTITVVVDPENTTGELNENNNEAFQDIYVYPPLADLTPTNIDFSDKTPVVNQTITISANVKNIGGIEASNVLVSLYDDGQLIGNTTIPWIPGKGEFKTASINYAFATDGGHTICVFVDPDNDIPEADEGNNWYCTDILIHHPLPDLTLSSSDITFSNSNPTVGNMIAIYGTIHNFGEVDAHNVTVEFFDGATRIAPPITIPLINANGQETVDASWNATPMGWHRIKVIIDGNNTIVESNEKNNMASRYIYVRPEVAADLCIYSEDIVFSNTNPDLGENVTIYVTVHNIGDADAEDITVVFYVDDIQLGSPETIPSIPVDKNETVSTKWIASQIGSHVVKAIVDTPIESNKNNNAATRAIIVGKHDIAIVNVTTSKTVVGQGYCINVTVNVENQGDYAEALNITAYYNDTAITLPDGKNHTTITLTSGSSTTVTLVWNTTDVAKGNYTISANATIPVDNDPSDNKLTDGWIIVAMVGDITGATPDPLDFLPDGKVDMQDIATVARAFGANRVTDPTSPKYGEYWHPPGTIPPCNACPRSPNCDINCDGKIDMKDVATAARHFGETDP